jgi:DNA-binding CsgD family transcriptional regulator
MTSDTHIFNSFIQGLSNRKSGEIAETLQTHWSHLMTAEFGHPLPKKSVAYYMLNYQTEQYLLLDEGLAALTEHSITDIEMGGLAFTRRLWKKEYEKVITREIMPLNRKYFLTIEATDRQYLSFVAQYTLTTRSKKERIVEQRSHFVSLSDNGTPAIVFGFLRDVTDAVDTCTFSHSIQLHGVEQLTVHARCHGLSSIGCKLTPRQTVILKLIAKGKSSKIISAELGIAQNTVENIRKSILRKTQSTNISEAIAKAMADHLW